MLRVGQLCSRERAELHHRDKAGEMLVQKFRTRNSFVPPFLGMGLVSSSPPLGSEFLFQMKTTKVYY